MVFKTGHHDTGRGLLRSASVRSTTAAFALVLTWLASGCGGDGPVASPTTTTGELTEAGSFDATSTADAGPAYASAAEASIDAPANAD